MGLPRVYRLLAAALFLPIFALVASLLLLTPPADPASPAQSVTTSATAGVSGLASGGEPAAPERAAADSGPSGSGVEADVTLDAVPPAEPAQAPTARSVQGPTAEPMQVRLTTVNRFYDVEGTDIRSLLTSVRQRGPRDDAGAWAASTAWTFGWAYQPVLAEACRAASATVDLQLTFTYPRLAVSSTVAQPVADAWTRYLTNVETHEQGHAQIAQAAAAELADTIRAVPAQPTCDDLAPAISAAATDVLQRHAQAQLAYDRETQHGVAQGAMLSLGQ